jgi:hypothetical protein
MKFKKIKIQKRGSMSFEEVVKSLNKIGIKVTKMKGSDFKKSWSAISGKNSKI